MAEDKEVVQSKKNKFESINKNSKFKFLNMKNLFNKSMKISDTLYSSNEIYNKKHTERILRTEI